MANQEELKAIVDRLVVAQASEAQRQIAQDEADAAQLKANADQIVTLTQTIADLQSAVASGAVPDSVVAQIQSVIDSLNAEKA